MEEGPHKAALPQLTQKQAKQRGGSTGTKSQKRMATEDVDDIMLHRIRHMQRSERLGLVDDMAALQYKKFVKEKKKRRLLTIR